MFKSLFITTFLFAFTTQAQMNCMELFSVPFEGSVFAEAIKSDTQLVAEINKLVARGILVERARAGGTDLAYLKIAFGNNEPVSYEGLFINELALKYFSQVPQLTSYLARLNKIMDLEAQGAVFTIDSFIYSSSTITITKVNSLGKLKDPTLQWMRRYPSTQFIFQGSSYWWHTYARDQFVNLNGQDLTMRLGLFEDQHTWEVLPQIVHNSGMTYQ